MAVFESNGQGHQTGAIGVQIHRGIANAPCVLISVSWQCIVGMMAVMGMMSMSVVGMMSMP